MGRLWDIVEHWRDGLEFAPSYRQIAIKMGVSQSAFDTWKHPIEMPRAKNLLAISELTGVPYRYVVQAALDDTQLLDENAVRKTLSEQAERELSPNKPQTQIAKEAKSDKRPQSDVG